MTIKADKNPIISQMGVCDPHVHIFRDRAYLYASHDQPAGSHVYDMCDWEIWSSADLVTWERESVVRPEDTSMGASWQCWAVDAAEKNGKYYLYVSNGTKETYVLVSDDPGKGFRDALGRPLLTEHISPTRSYDPAVFTDDDGSSYIIFGTPVWAGGDSYYIARLNGDMISLAETPRKVALDDSADDKPFLHKRNGLYYLTWASYYATSDCVYGPYTTRGNLGLSADHGSFFEWHGQWFKAFTVDESIGKMRRATGLAYIHFRANGEMRADQLIREFGVGQYDGRWNQIEAEWFMKGHAVEKLENPFNSFDVAMRGGSWVEYPNIRRLPENPWLVINGVSETAVDVEVYADGLPMGVLRKEASYLRGGEFTKYSLGSLRLTLPAGDHTLRLAARGNLRLNHFRFMDGPA